MYRLSTGIVLVAFLSLIVPEPGAGQILRVSPSGPVRSVARAVALAEEGQEIAVAPGVYFEDPIVIDKSLTITGEPGAVLDGDGTHQILTVRADSVVIRGLRLRNVGVSFMEDRAAIKVDGGHDCLIENNTVEDAFFAIYLAKSAGCVIRGNEIYAHQTQESQSGNGIHLWYCKSVRIESNHITGHRDGIYFEFVEDTIVRGNLSEGNLRYGLHFMFSDRCKYLDNVFRRNNAGVAVMYTKNVEMLDNRFEHNWGSAAYGLLLKDITDSVIRSNRFVTNTVGLYAEGANRIDVEANVFEDNGWAVKVMANCIDSRFIGNDFLGNTFDVTTNGRTTRSTFARNYWDHYEGYDLDRDGFGDVPFRPVRLFSLMVEQNEPALILQESLLVRVLDTMERVIPGLTPAALVDERPRMRRHS